MEKRLSRRALLRMGASMVGAGALAACQPKIVEKIVKETVVVTQEKVVEKVVKETVMVAGTPKVVEKVVEKVVQQTVVVQAGRDIFQGTLDLWQPWGTGYEGGALPFVHQCADFPKLHPGVKINHVYDSTKDKYLAAIAAKNPPDLLTISAPDIPTLAQRGALMALDPFIERDKWDMTQYWPMAVDQCSWRGKNYAITHHPDVRVMFHDQAVFKEVGLDPNAEPKSWQEIIDWGKAMSKQDKGRYVRFGFVPTWVGGTWANHYMVANGVVRIDEEGRTAKFHTAAAEEAMAWVVKCINEVCGGYENTIEFVEIHATPDGKGAYWMFPYHRMGSVLYGNWLFSPIVIIDPKQPVNLSTFPGGPSNPNTKHVFHGGTMTAIPSDAKHWELAWEFLKYMSSETNGNGVRFIQECGDDISGNIKESTSAEALKFPGRPKMMELFKDAKSPSYLKSPISQQWDVEMRTMGEKILLKKQTIPEALAETQKIVQKALNDFWATA
ncbi:MAG: extracellular solute-binding protein [Chloroflexota bacterium]